ncbi:MAG: complex I subunit 5 family protein [Clostridiales bacterium]|nr:complex I subunit 5 family protein [Clostridiales bacterium]
MQAFTKCLLGALILLPIAGAAASALAGKRRPAWRERTLRLCTCAELLFALLLFVQSGKTGGEALKLDGLCGASLSFRTDGFRALYALIASFMWAAASQFSLQYFSAHGEHMNRYAFFTLLTLSGTVGVFLADDLYTAFLFFEIMSIASYPWVAHEETPEAMRAAGTYLFVSVICGMITLMGLFLYAHRAGDASFAALRQNAGKAELILPGCLMLVGFCAKAGMFPLHVWLPKAHPVAPAPSSALLSGVLTKTGVFGIIGIGLNLMDGCALFGQVLLALGLVTMTLGAVLAVFSVNLKRTLACSSMSQIGYITVGISCALLLGKEGGLAAAGAVGHMINHSLLKLCLFLCAGAVYMDAHTLDLNKLKGYGRGKPLLHAVFLIGALGLMGVPLLNGYASKTMIHEGLAELAAERSGFSAYRAAEWLFLFAAGLTTAYMLKLYICLFWQKKEADAPSHHAPLTARSAGVLIVTAVPVLVFGMLPNQTLLPLARLCSDFMNREAPEGPVAFFSAGNLLGGGVSLWIGVIVYLLFVRRALYDGRYLDRWPKRLDLEEMLYRPLIVKWLSGILGKSLGALDGLADTGFIRRGIPRAVNAAARFLDGLPERAAGGIRKLFAKKQKDAAGPRRS